MDFGIKLPAKVIPESFSYASVLAPLLNIKSLSNNVQTRFIVFLVPHLQTQSREVFNVMVSFQIKSEIVTTPAPTFFNVANNT